VTLPPDPHCTGSRLAPAWLADPGKNVGRASGQEREAGRNGKSIPDTSQLFAAGPTLREAAFTADLRPHPQWIDHFALAAESAGGNIPPDGHPRNLCPRGK